MALVLGRALRGGHRLRLPRPDRGARARADALRLRRHRLARAAHAAGRDLRRGDHTAARRSRPRRRDARHACSRWSPRSPTGSRRSSTTCCSRATSTRASCSWTSRRSTPPALTENVVESAQTHLPESVSLSVQVEKRLPPVAADEQQLRQVLVNLVENAVKYSPEGGPVTVAARARRSLRALGGGRRGPRHPRLRAAPRLREVLPPRPEHDPRHRRHGARPLHLPRAGAAPRRPDLGRGERRARARSSSSSCRSPRPGRSSPSRPRPKSRRGDSNPWPALYKSRCSTS